MTQSPTPPSRPKETRPPHNFASSKVRFLSLGNRWLIYLKKRIGKSGQIRQHRCPPIPSRAVYRSMLCIHLDIWVYPNRYQNFHLSSMKINDTWTFPCNIFQKSRIHPKTYRLTNSTHAVIGT